MPSRASPSVFSQGSWGVPPRYCEMCYEQHCCWEGLKVMRHLVYRLGDIVEVDRVIRWGLHLIEGVR